jgi:hypothetical protein
MRRPERDQRYVEMIFELLAPAIDLQAIIGVQRELLMMLYREHGADDDRVSKLARRYLRRAWRRVGKHVIVELIDDSMPIDLDADEEANDVNGASER